MTQSPNTRPVVMPAEKTANASAATAALGAEVAAQVEPAPVGHRALGDHHEQAQDRQQQDAARGEREARRVLALGRRALADPRRAGEHDDASSSAEASATVMRGSTPSAASPAAKPAPITPPNDQPACSEDMIGRPRSRSTLTPCAFIETSIVAFDAPSTNSAERHEQRMRRERSTRLTASASARPPSQRHPHRAVPDDRPGPAIGKARMTATDMPIRTSPICALREVEALLDPRDLRDERADHGAVDEEHAGGRPAPAHARVTVTPMAR